MDDIKRWKNAIEHEEWPMFGISFVLLILDLGWLELLCRIDQKELILLAIERFGSIWNN